MRHFAPTYCRPATSQGGIYAFHVRARLRDNHQFLESPLSLLAAIEVRNYKEEGVGEGP
jgi:hypothetical protein